VLAAVLVGVVGVGLALTWGTIRPTAQTQGANSGPKVIRATQFILEDENGKLRAMPSANKDAPRLDLAGEDGKPRIGLSVSKEGPALLLLDENGKARVGLAVSKGGPWLALFDETGKVIRSLL
jgi:hypothetical protein